MTSIDRRELQQRDKLGRTRTVVRYKIRYRDRSGRAHSETKRRLVDAERRRAEIDLELSGGTWNDPRRGEIRFSRWAGDWLLTRHDLRPTTHARLATTLARQVPAEVRQHDVVEDHERCSSGLGGGAGGEWSVASHGPQGGVRLASMSGGGDLGSTAGTESSRRCPAAGRATEAPRFLSQTQVERLVDEMSDRYKALVLVGAYGGLRWGEAVGLTRANVDVLRSRIIVETTAIEVHGKVTLGQEPKTRRSKRTVPVARSVTRRLEQHLDEFVGAEPGALMFTARRGGPLFRSTFAREAWRPAVEAAGITGFTFHGLRHSFVAILVSAGCNVREVS